MNDDFVYRLSELERRLENLLRLGTVAELDAAAAKVRVKSGNLLTAFLPWLTRRAGADCDWWAPEVSEQVIVLSPSGDLSQGVVLPALYQNAHPAPADSSAIARIAFADGGFAEYDRDSGVLNLYAMGEIKIFGADKISLDGGSGDLAGVITGQSICHFTGAPHADPSTNVEASKG